MGLGVSKGKVLRLAPVLDDNPAVFRAAANAQKAVKYLYGLLPLHSLDDESVLL